MAAAAATPLVTWPAGEAVVQTGGGDGRLEIAADQILLHAVTTEGLEEVS